MKSTWPMRKHAPSEPAGAPDAKWWDLRTPIDVQQHVSAILAIARMGLQRQGTAGELPTSQSNGWLSWNP